jgi:hypothetical protein
VEARQTLTGGFVRKRERLALAIFVALALAGASAVITKDLGGTGPSAQPVVHPAPGTVLRQDNPVQPLVHPAPSTVLRQDNPVQGRSTSNQIVGDAGLAADGNLPESDLTRVLP